MQDMWQKLDVFKNILSVRNLVLPSPCSCIQSSGLSTRS